MLNPFKFEYKKYIIETTSVTTVYTLLCSDRLQN